MDDILKPMVEPDDPEAEAIWEMFEAIVNKADHNRSMALAILSLLVCRVLDSMRRSKKRDDHLVWFLNHVAAHYHYAAFLAPDETMPHE